MLRRSLVVLTVLVASAGGARGQVGPSPVNPANPGGVGAGMIANPYANPYLNPYLNPYMTQQGNMSGKNALLYLYSAQQQQGFLSQKPPRSKATAASATPAKTPANRGPGVGEMPQSLMVPGGSASNYFQRAPTPRANGKRGASYMRYGGYFGNNGR